MTCPDWTLFFLSGARVLALPNWRRPRLYLSAEHPLQRWRHSSLYPASRLGAKLYRLSLRLQAAAGTPEVRTVSSDGWPLGEFARGVLPQLASAVVLMGTPGPTQEITVRLQDGRGHDLGFLKYARKDAARKRLRQERYMLSNLPAGVGAEPLRYGPFGGGEALLKSPLPGKTLGAVLPPPGRLFSLLSSLVLTPSVPLEEHPWARRMRDERNSPKPEAWFERLERREWPVVIQHGDFVSWNLLMQPDGTLRAIDWEYGTLEGFPYLDLIYYILQTSALIYRWSPAKAFRYATAYLHARPEFALDEAESEALVCLTAYDSYCKSLDDGQAANFGLQAWRRAVWDGEACT